MRYKTVMMNKFLILCCLLVGAIVPETAAQSLPKIEIGSIVSLTYINGQSGPSPLAVNRGEGTFLNQWVLFLGSQFHESLSLFAEVQTAKGIRFSNYGLSAIYQPKGWSHFGIEVGKFLVPFGTFLGRRWASENPFIEFPLIYEYQTVLSAFDLPRNEGELLKVRGQGDGFQYHDHDDSPNERLAKLAAPGSAHIPRSGSGLRMISREVYPTGVQVFGTVGNVRYNFGVTNGALSNPVDINNSSAVQILGRLRYNPFLGLDLGASFASGVYLDKESVDAQLQEVGRRAEDFRQTSLGFDVSYSAGHLVFFSELLFNRWESPFIAENLDALAFYVEAKYKFLTRLYVAGRFSSIDFMEIADPQDVDNDGKFRASWDFDVHQWEAGLGYRVNRNALIKAVVQLNRTRGAPGGDPADDFFALQSVVFF